MRFALSGWTDLSGLSFGFQTFDTPSVLLFPMPALFPASPVMLKLLIRYVVGVREWVNRRPMRKSKL
jgi:hypothetical protein